MIRRAVPLLLGCIEGAARVTYARLPVMHYVQSAYAEGSERYHRG